MKTAKEWKKFYSTPEFRTQYTYEGHDLGVSCTQEGTVFRIWSPCAESIDLNFYKDGSLGDAERSVPMGKAEAGVWTYRTTEELHGTYYDYTIRMEGTVRRTADPYARACGPNGARSMAVNLARTNPEGWEQDKAPERPMENIIYELHVKEFSWDVNGGFPEEYRGKYKAFLCENTTLNGDGIHPTGCAYLKELGITHVQLMPVYDYGSVDETGHPEEFNWGYDPVNYNVPEGSYATDVHRGEVRIREMKEMIQALHRQGFRVIMDVVYNHTYSLDSWFQRTVPWYYYRVHEDGTVSDGSACGNDTANERPMCAGYILDSVLYWAEEYHIDGFRFDLMGLLDVELMNRIRTALDHRYGGGEKLLFGEPWAASESAIEGAAKGALKENLSLLEEGVGIFCDNTRNAIKGSVFDVDKVGFANGASGLEEDILKCMRAWQKTEELDVKSPAQIITYISAHDNHTLWDKIIDTVPDERKWMKVNKMAAAICMTCQGNLFLLSGEEFARTKNGLDNSYNAPISLNCLEWKRAWENQELVEYYKGLITLRMQLPGLCDKTKDAWKRIEDTWTYPGAVGCSIQNTDGDRKVRWSMLYIIYNGRENFLKVSLPEGDWEILADAKSSQKWRHPQEASHNVYVEPISVLVLGKNEEVDRVV